ncbi:hypothetical protein MJO28_005457 [Puccinia striiformis f. sp. tritici]|uniref:Uncharacterized protein n=1 Tax=Puccinia striiformis f. sp. tritici TaxID=168172 RepID=A0ACC0EMG9_9BASI|nr:hypothetical protein MJO28_005457 [Puccinia striiformis f. sp. tritici]KAI7960432.1 hypothetical protein MJO29_005500 [Puccinia striiformis f. sp. tritici]
MDQSNGADGYAQILRVLQLTHSSISTRTTMTQMNLAYHSVSYCSKNLMPFKPHPNSALHFIKLPGCKGIFHGDLTIKFEIDGEMSEVHGKTSATLIPDMEGQSTTVTPGHKVKFILILEKEFSMRYPDLASRMVACQLAKHPDIIQRKVPTYILTDGDPHGISIAIVYQYGGKCMSLYPGLVTPDAKRTGISPRDWHLLGINRGLLRPLEWSDYKKIDELLQLEDISATYKKDLKDFEVENVKSDITDVEKSESLCKGAYKTTLMNFISQCIQLTKISS